MLNKEEAKVDAWGAIADMFGLEYFREHFEEACHSYPDDQYDDIEYEYFMGFESKDGLWTVYAKVLVNRETKEVSFLDYKTPDGICMDNPIKPITFA